MAERKDDRTSAISNEQAKELLGKLKPALVKYQPKVIGGDDNPLLKEWERLVTTRFGLPEMGGAPTVSKTIDSCMGAGFDLTDTD
jgi:hypothetical protein